MYIIAKVRVSGAEAVAVERKRIPRGISGAAVELIYDDAIWAELTKKVAFRGAVETEKVYDSNIVPIPQEVVMRVNARVSVGVTGVNSDGSVVIPTLWAELGSVYPSSYGDYPAPGEPVPPLWKQALDMIGDLEELDTEAKDNLVHAVNEAAKSGGGGLSDNARELLLAILRAGVYTSDQSANIAALETALASGSGSGGESGGESGDDEGAETVTYTVTNTLSNVTTNNTLVSVVKNEAYTATLTAVDGYELDTVTVTMGGVDITATAYSNGVVTIAAVTGNVVITAAAVESSTGDDTVENNGWTEGEAYAIEWTDGYGIDSTAANETFGEAIENSARSVSDYLPCLGASAITIGTGIYANYGIYFYDEEKTLLQRVNVNTESPAAVPLNAHYVRVQCVTTNKATATVTPLSYTEASETTPWTSGEYFSALHDEVGSLNVSTGAVTTGTSWLTTGFVFCYGAATLKANSHCTNFRTSTCFYDADKNFISGSTVTGSSWTVPENAKYFRHSTYNGDQYNNGQGHTNPWFILE